MFMHTHALYKWYALAHWRTVTDYLIADRGPVPGTLLRTCGSPWFYAPQAGHVTNYFSSTFSGSLLK